MSAFRIILVLIALELITITLLLVATLLTQAHKSGSRMRRRMELWETMLPAALAGEQQAVTLIRASLRSEAAWKAFHNFIDENLRHEQGDSTLSFRRLSRHVRLTDRLHRQLVRSRDPLDRAAAARTLARLRERVAEETVLELLKSKDPAVVLVAAYATASFRDPRQLLPVFRAIYGRTPITLHGAAELLSGFGEGVCPVIHGLLQGAVGQYEATSTPGAMVVPIGTAAPVGTAVPINTVAADPEQVVDRDEAAAQVVMVDLLTFYRYRPAASTLAQLLTFTTNEEVLIHLVKALALLGDASAVPRLSELLGHPSWVVRRQSIQALAALAVVEAAPAVRALLGDDNLMVRASAHDTLRALQRARARRRKKVVEALT